MKGSWTCSLAERHENVDPLNLIQVMLAEEKRVKEYTQKKGFYKASELEFKVSKQSSRTKNTAVAAVLTGLTVALSSFYIPLGTTKCFPAQHMINGIAGVLLGPWYAMFMALATGIIRNLLGLGTVYAFPGGIPGALVVGLIHRYVAESDLSALAEPLGTVGIGATLSALLFAPMLGQSLTLYFFWVAFAASSVPGAILGYIVLKGLRRLGVDKLLV